VTAPACRCVGGEPGVADMGDGYLVSKKPGRATTSGAHPLALVGWVRAVC